MLDDILREIKDVVLHVVSENGEIPSSKKELATEVATNAIMEAFADNIKSLDELSTGNGSSSVIMSSIQKTVVKMLIQKTGLDSNVANGLVSSMLPAAIKAIAGKFGIGENGNFSLDLVKDALAENGGQKQKIFGAALGAFGDLLK